MSATQEISTCDCVHHNALTCIAEQNGMSRFNASIIFATSTKEERNGRCTCCCHRDRHGKPISEQAWQAARPKPISEEEAKPKKRRNRVLESVRFAVAPTMEKTGPKARAAR